MSRTTNNQVRIIACGGAAIASSSIFELCRGIEEVGVAPVDVVYVDTSHASFTDKIPQEARFIVPGDKDGSGGDRKENAADIRQAVDSLLDRFAPGYVTIVISSASGGSGSVIAPSVTAKLIDRDCLVIPVLIGDARQGHWITNTLNTLATYEKIAEIKNKALPVAYFENTAENPPSAVDQSIADMVAAITILFSRQNEGLDTRDLYNFLNFNRMTSYGPHCGLLSTISGEIGENNSKGIMTAMSLSTDKDTHGVSVVLPYAKHGILPNGVSEEILARTPLHVVTRAYPFNEIADNLKATIRALEEEARARTKTSTVLTGVGAASASADDFLIL